MLYDVPLSIDIVANCENLESGMLPMKATDVPTRFPINHTDSRSATEEVDLPSNDNVNDPNTVSVTKAG